MSRRRNRAGGVPARALLSLAFIVSTSVAAQWPESEYSPNPLPEDVVIPLPCGGAAVFARVVIPSEGPLGDRLVTIGGADSDRGYAESARRAHIAGSFSDAAGRYYLIGRYEISRLQYQSVSGECSDPTPALRMPQTNVSWFDAVQFSDRLNQWLRKNASKSLPQEEDELGFVRLPTEVEWEFAARGGINVSDSEFGEPVFPMSEGLERYVWHGGTESSNNELQRVGLLRPNPLGLHDMLGNADEIMFEPFRLNKLDRLHGQAGGFIVRGGSYVTPAEDVRTSYRHEVPYYQGAAPRRSPTTGLRLVMVAPVLTSRNRVKDVDDAWWELGSGAGPGDAEAEAKSQSDQAIGDLGEIAKASADAELKSKLEQLQLDLRASFHSAEEQQGRAAKARLRLGSFLCQKMRDDGLAVDGLKRAKNACMGDRGAEAERCRRYDERIESEEAAVWKNLRYYTDTIVQVVTDYDDDVLSQQLSIFEAELDARGNRHLVPMANEYVKHVRRYRKEKVLKRSALLDACKGV